MPPALALLLALWHGLPAALDANPTPYQDAVAVALYTAPWDPAGPPEPPPPDDDVPALKLAVSRLAVLDEVLDPAYQEHFWARAEPTWCGEVPAAGDLFMLNLATIRVMREDVADAPRLFHLGRFPSHDACVADRSAARAHLVWLERRRDYELDRRALLDAALAEARLRHRAWDLLADASNPVYGPHYRRLRLADLRALLGQEAWLAGEMPGPVSDWTLKEVNP